MNDVQNQMEESTPPRSRGTERYHALDALRAFALLLGVVFHAAESFEAGHTDWAIVDPSPSTILHLFRHASHSFRLEIFFLIAGFFARLVYHRRGWREFMRNRCSRVLVPFAAGWCLLYPLVVLIWIWGGTKSGNWETLGIPAEFRHLAPWQLVMGFFVTFQFVQKFNLTHLWFLHQLLVIYVLVLVARGAFVRWADAGGEWRTRIDGWFCRLMGARWTVLWLTLASVPLLLMMASWNVDTPFNSLIPQAPTTLLFGVFFMVGWLLHRQPALLTPLGRRWKAHLCIGVLSVLPSRYGVMLAGQLGWLPQHTAWVRLAHSVLYGLMMWSLVLGFCGLFVRHAANPSLRWRYVADSSYWIYIAHLPLVVALQVWLADVKLHWTLKFPLILLIALPVLFLSYHFLVRSTFIGQQLNGRKHRLRLPGEVLANPGDHCRK